MSNIGEMVKRSVTEFLPLYVVLERTAFLLLQGLDLSKPKLVYSNQV